MFLAMCIDGGIILAALFWLLLIGVICCAAFVFTLILIMKCFNAWRERRRAEASPAAS